MGTEIAMSEHLTQPGETGGWPKLKVSYRTDPEKIAALLPPGLEPSGDPIVQINVYCVPILAEPEYGVSTMVQLLQVGHLGRRCILCLFVLPSDVLLRHVRGQCCR